MKYRKLGKTGLEISEIGFGTWATGGAMWGGSRDDDSREAFERAISHGVNFFDTALVYGNGHAENLVGELKKKHPTIIIASKVPPKSMQWPAYPTAKLKDNFPKDYVIASCEKSLKNLGVETIDLLQLHTWADAWTDESEWYEALTELKRAGKILAAGVSLNSHDPRSGVRLVQSGRIDAVQTFYNIFDQSPEDELFPACEAHGVGVLARVPFDEGSLTGKFKEDTTFPAGDFRASYFPNMKEVVKRVEAIRPIIEGVAPSMARGALRFCLSHHAVSTVIPGIRNITQADENTAASNDGPLPAATLDALRAHRWVRTPY